MKGFWLPGLNSSFFILLFLLLLNTENQSGSSGSSFDFVGTDAEETTLRCHLKGLHPVREIKHVTWSKNQNNIKKDSCS